MPRVEVDSTDNSPKQEVSNDFFAPNVVEDFAAKSVVDESKVMNVHIDQGNKINPEMAARVARMQTATGFPNDVVAQNIDQIEADNKVEKFSPDFWKKSPLTAKYIRDNSPYYSGMSDDEILSLGHTEQLLGQDPIRWRKPKAFVEREADALSRRQFSEMKGLTDDRGELTTSARSRLNSFIEIEQTPEQTEQFFNQILEGNLADLQFEEDFIASDVPIGGFETLRNRFKENSAFMLPFISSGGDITRLTNLYRAALAVDEGTATDGQADMLLRYGRIAEAAERRGVSVLGLTADIAATSIPFMAELYLTAGTYTAGARLGEKGLRIATEKLLRGSIEKVLKRKVVAKTAEFAVKTGGKLIGVAAQAPLAGVTRIPTGILRDITPIGFTQFGEDGSVSFKVVPKSGKPFGLALRQNVYSQMTAVFTEKLGGPLGRVGKRVTAKAFDKFPAVKSLFSSFVKQGGKADKFVSTLQTAGLHGILSEFAEEEVDKWLQDVGGIQKYEWPTVKELKAQGLAFGAPVLLTGGIRVAETRNARLRQAAANKQVLDDLSESVLQDETILQNNPIEYKRILHDKVEGTPLESVKLPIEQFNQVFEGKTKEDGTPINPREVVIEIMGDANAYDEAVETGGDIEIPMEEYATTLNIGEFAQDLSSVAKFSSTDSTAAETEKLLDNLESNLGEQEVQLEEQERVAEAVRSAKLVADDIRSQFDDTGAKFDIVAADNYAKLYERVFRTLGIENNVDPLELYNQFKLSITEQTAEGKRPTKEEDQRTTEELNAAIAVNREKLIELEGQRRTFVGSLEDVEVIADPVAVAAQVTEVEKQEATARREIKAAEQRLRDVEEGAELGEDAFFFQGAPVESRQLGFFSGLKTAVEGLKQQKGTASQFLAQIKKQPGVKQEELEWTGLGEFLKGDETRHADRKISKDEILQYLDNNGVQIEEVTLSEDSAELIWKGNELIDPDGNVRGTIQDGDSGFIWIDNEGDGSGNLLSGSNMRAAIEEVEQKIGSDTVSGGNVLPKFSDYTLEGGTNYREVLLTLPTRRDLTTEEQQELDILDQRPFAELTEVEQKRANELLDIKAPIGKGFKSGHFDQPNILAHVRLTDRVDSEGNKVLFVEEIQSDWHQAGRKSGYKRQLTTEENQELDDLFKQKEAVFDAHGGAANVIVDGKKDDAPQELKDALDSITDIRLRIIELENIQGERSGGSSTGAVPDAPFKGNAWAELSIKRIITMAAEGGYDKIGWTTGAQQIDRFEDSLRKNVDEIRYERVDQRDGETTFIVEALKGENSVYKSTRNMTEQDIQDLLGKDIAKKISSGEGDIEGDSTILRGDGLSIGGEGMKSFYDRVVPNLFKKVVKKLDKNAKVGESNIETEREDIFGEGGIGFQGKGDFITEPVHSLDITPKLSETVQERGQTLFQGSGKDAEIVRGSIQFGTNHGVKIDLFKDADLTTFLHESGHFFLEILNGLSLKEGASSKTIADVQAIKDWFKEKPIKDVIKEIEREVAIIEKAAKKDDSLKEEAANAREALNMAKEGGQEFMDEFVDTFGKNVDSKFWGVLMTPYHEQWARGFEMYLADPKNAPTPELRGLFYRFSKWIKDFYNTLLNLNVELSQDIKNVMSRMVATSDEIEEAQADQGMAPLFPDPLLAGMNEKDAERYQEGINEALQKATEDLNEKAIEMDLRKKKSEWRERKNVVEPQVTQEANEERVYVSLANMQKGKKPDGSPLDSGVFQVKLNKAELKDAVGPERFSNLPRGISSADGVDIDFGANLLGYESAKEMILEIELSPKKSDYIQAETDRILHQELGDPLSPDVLEQSVDEALHSDKRSRVLKMEIDHLASQNLPVLKGLIKRAATPMASIEAVKQRAKQIIGKKAVGKIKPIIYKRGESKSSKLAIESLLKGDIQQATQAKQLELLNHELYREAVEARKQVDKELEFAKKLQGKDKKLAKTRDMGMVNTGRSILAAYKIGNFDERFVEANLSYLIEYGKKAKNNDVHFVLNKMREKVMVGSNNFKEVPFEEFEFMMETVRAFWKLSKAVKTIKVGDEARSADEVAQMFVAELVSRPNFKPGSLKLANPFSNMDRKSLKEGVFAAANQLKRMEHWVEKMDDGDPRGIFHKFLWNPIIEATTEYKIQRNALLKEFNDSLAKIKDTLKSGNIKANELPQKATKDNPDGFYTFADKSALLGALLHVGNKSNLSKLIRGRKWGAYDAEGVLDTSAWDAFIDRMIKEEILTKKDLDFVQQVRDMYEKTKDKAQKAHFELYGFHFNEVTANEIVTPFGNYRGGYVPAILDYADFEHLSTEDGRPVSDDQMQNGAFSDMFPQTQKGMTLDRNENFAGPLDFNLSRVRANLDKVLRFSHLEVPVRNVYNLVTHDLLKGNDKKDINGALTAIDPTLIDSLIMPWLNRVAQQMVTRPAEGKVGQFLDPIFRDMRKKSVNNIMFGNVVNILEQVTGFSVAASEVEVKYMQRALMESFNNPKAFMKRIKDSSEYMQTRDLSEVMMQNADMRDMLLNPSTYQKVSQFADKYSMYGQMIMQGFVDSIVWRASEIKSEESIVDYSDKEIQLIADSVVRRTQGDYSPESISAVETQKSFIKMFITFFGYFNTISGHYFTRKSIIKRTSDSKGQETARNFWLWFTVVSVPAISGAILRRLLREGGDADGDDEILDDYMAVLVGSQLETITAAIPDGGAIQYVFNQFDDKWWNDDIGGSPTIQLLKDSISALKSVPEAIFFEGSVSKAVKDTGAAITSLTGAPTKQFTKTAGFFIDLANDSQEAESFDDFLRGVIGGRSGK